MKKRPPTITAISILYMVVGLVSTSYHFNEFKAYSPTFLNALGTVLMIVLGATAIAAGYFMLQGRNWARWLAFSWTLFHVIVAAFNSLGGLIFHSVFVFLLALLLFSKEAKEWFTPNPAIVPVAPPLDVPQVPPPDQTDVPPPPTEPQS
jgi:hypothetical protein